MEKINIKSVKKSGIQTAYITGYIFCALGIIGGLYFIFTGILDVEDMLIGYGIGILLSFVAVGVVLITLSAILRQLHIANIQRDRLLKSKGIDLSCE